MARRWRKKLYRRAVWLWGRTLHRLDQSLAASWNFLCNWIINRPFREFLWGLPAVIIALVVSLVLIGSGRSSADLAVRYRKSVRTALEQGDTHAADLWLAKVVRLDPDEPSFLYSLAMEADRDGRMDRARQIMRRIAPERDQGFAAAHLWLARDLVRDSPPLTPDLQQSLEHHLTSASNGQELADEAHGLLGLLFLQLQDTRRALPLLEQAAKTQLEPAIRLGQIYAARGEKSRAESVLAEPLLRLKQIVSEDPLNAQARLQYAECQKVLGNYAVARQFLEDAPGSQDPRIAQQRVELFLQQFNREWEQQRSQSLAPLELLKSADQIMPNNPQVLNRLSLLAHPAGPVRDWVKQFLAKKVDQGQDSPFVHFVLGVLAEREDDFDRATMHYQRAIEQGPQTMELMNNLAWALANRDPPELDQALELAEKALAISPDHPLVLDTRGQILAKLGRWSECISDLELALERGFTSEALHDTLALAYEKIGVQPLAAAHRRKAVEFRQTHSEQGG